MRQALHDHRGHATQHVQLQGRRVAQVDDPPGNEGPAVVHPHDHLPAIGGIRHPCVAGNGHGGVRRRHAKHVVRLTTGGRTAVVLAPVPGSATALHQRQVTRDGHVQAPGHLVGLVGAASPQRLHAGHRVGHFRQPGRHGQGWAVSRQIRRCRQAGGGVTGTRAGGQPQHQAQHHQGVQGRAARRRRFGHRSCPSWLAQRATAPFTQVRRNAGATGKNRTCDAAFGGPHDIHFTTVAERSHSSARPWPGRCGGVSLEGSRQGSPVYSRVAFEPAPLRCRPAVPTGCSGLVTGRVPPVLTSQGSAG